MAATTCFSQRPPGRNPNPRWWIELRCDSVCPRSGHVAHGHPRSAGLRPALRFQSAVRGNCIIGSACRSIALPNTAGNIDSTTRIPYKKRHANRSAGLRPGSLVSCILKYAASENDYPTKSDHTEMPTTLRHPPPLPNRQSAITN
jgi:hypothetical protein